jgi:hypothetical protein
MLQRALVLAASLALAGALGAVPARAGDAPGLSDAAPFLMPDTSGRTHAGVDVFFGTVNADENDPLIAAEATVLSFEPHLDLALTQELTLWGRLPVSYTSARTTLLGIEQEDSGTLLGNAGLGARFMSQASQELRAGGGVLVHLPTSSADAGGDLVDLPLATAVVRSFHPERYAIETTTLGAHADVRFDAGRAFVQGQALYMHLAAEDESVEDADLLRLSLAAGFWVTPNVATMAELTTLSTILDEDVQLNPENQDEDFFHSLDVGLRFAQPQWALSVRFHLPLDELFRDNDILGGGADLALYF